MWNNRWVCCWHVFNTLISGKCFLICISYKQRSQQVYCPAVYGNYWLLFKTCLCKIKRFEGVLLTLGDDFPPLMTTYYWWKCVQGSKNYINFIKCLFLFPCLVQSKGLCKISEWKIFLLTWLLASSATFCSCSAMTFPVSCTIL